MSTLKNGPAKAHHASIPEILMMALLLTGGIGFGWYSAGRLLKRGIPKERTHSIEASSE